MGFGATFTIAMGIRAGTPGQHECSCAEADKTVGPIAFMAAAGIVALASETRTIAAVTRFHMGRLKKYQDDTADSCGL